MIVDASVVVDAVADPGPRGNAARAALADTSPYERLASPGHLAIEVLSALNAAAQRPGHPLTSADLPEALDAAAALEIMIEPTPWRDVSRAWELSRASLRYADAIYVAAAERQNTALLTADARIERSGAQVRCVIVTISP